ncbi:hypothetical protein PWT90_02155 [Aphanocladium album]|nr:hypothetical protein PWT90_02155 [Aphanocladium album]
MTMESHVVPVESASHLVVARARGERGDSERLEWPEGQKCRAAVWGEIKARITLRRSQRAPKQDPATRQARLWSWATAGGEGKTRRRRRHECGSEQREFETGERGRRSGRGRAAGGKEEEGTSEPAGRRLGARAVLTVSDLSCLGWGGAGAAPGKAGNGQGNNRRDFAHSFTGYLPSSLPLCPLVSPPEPEPKCSAAPTADATLVLSHVANVPKRFKLAYLLLLLLLLNLYLAAPACLLAEGRNECLPVSPTRVSLPAGPCTVAPPQAHLANAAETALGRIRKPVKLRRPLPAHQRQPIQDPLCV